MTDFWRTRAYRVGRDNAKRVRRLMREGRCVRCTRKKHADDLHHQNCRKCRRKHADRQAQRNAQQRAAAERLQGPLATHFGKLSPRERRLFALGLTLGERRVRGSTA